VEWTSETPTEDGVYWMRMNREGTPECQIVEVYRGRLLFMGTGHDHDLKYTVGDADGIIWHWYGPLIAPEWSGCSGVD